MSRSLQSLISAIRDDLGDADDLFKNSALERFLQEGQRKLEPDHLLDKVLTSFSWADGATSVVLPTDLYEISTIVPDSTSYVLPRKYRHHGTSLYFDPRDTVYAFSGDLFYRAHYPAITTTVPCTLPDAAADAIVSWSLYRAYHKLASNRAEYRRYVTLSQNGVTIDNLMSTANTHLADFNDVKKASGRPARIAFYTDED